MVQTESKYEFLLDVSKIMQFISYVKLPSRNIILCCISRCNDFTIYNKHNKLV